MDNFSEVLGVLGISGDVVGFWGILARWGILWEEMREGAGLCRAAVWVGCAEGEDHRRRRGCQDVDRVLAGHQRVHEPALQQWAVAAGLRQERRGALPQGLWLPSSNPVAVQIFLLVW